MVMSARSPESATVEDHVVAILRKVAGEKMPDEVTAEVRLRADLALDSVDVMETLIEMRDQVVPADLSPDSPVTKAVTDEVLAYLGRRCAGEDMTLGSLRDLYDTLLGIRNAESAR